MKNLLDSTEIATIFLDNNLVILRFTPTVKAMFSIIAVDIGRSITDIVFNFDFPDFEKVILQVIETLAAKELEITTKNGIWYNLRIMPYRTLDNFINGVVLTFTNITALKFSENKMNTLIEYSKNMVRLMPAPALLLNQNQQVLIANGVFTDFFKLNEQDLTGVIFPVIAHEFWKTTRLDKMIKSYQQEKTTVLLDQDFPGIGKKHLSFTSLPSIDQHTKETLLILIVIEEVKAG